MVNDEEYPAQTPTPVSRPIVSRLNRLNSLMRRFGGKKILWGKSSQEEKDEHDPLIEKSDGKYVSMDEAIQETCSKGSLLERIASLEERLVQMCLEIESYRRSCNSSINTSSGASSSSNNGSRIERMCSYPTFGYKPQCKQHPLAPCNLSGFEAQIPRQQHNGKPSSTSMKQQPKLQGSKKERKTGRKWKKGMSPSWSHLKILGC